MNFSTSLIILFVTIGYAIPVDKTGKADKIENTTVDDKVQAPVPVDDKVPAPVPVDDKVHVDDKVPEPVDSTSDVSKKQNSYEQILEKFMGFVHNVVDDVREVILHSLNH
jgi:hypothetical protein